MCKLNDNPFIKVLSDKILVGKGSESFESKETQMALYTTKDLPKGYSVKNGHIHVTATIDGVSHRYSLSRIPDKEGKRFCERNSREQVILNIIANKKEVEDTQRPESFEEYGLRYLYETSGNRKSATQKDYKSLFLRKILPYFSGYNWKDFNADDVASFLYSMKSEYSGERARRVKNIFANIIDSAVYDDLIIKDPFKAAKVKNISFPSYSNKEAYTKVEMLDILTKSEGWLKVYLNISFIYGVRQCEMVGLKWSDIDFETSSIHIRRAITKEEGVIEGSNGDKNHYRDIVALDYTMELLKDLRNNSLYDKEFVFFPTGGKAGPHWFSSDDINRHYFKPFLKEIGIKYKTLRSARNSAATLNLSDGLGFAFEHMLTGKMDNDHNQLIETRKMLGHSTGSKVTTNHYYKPEAVDHTDKVKIANMRFMKLIEDAS